MDDQLNWRTFYDYRSYAIDVGPDYTSLSAENTKHLKDLGFLIHPYTVDKTTDMQRLNQYGVAGLFTNFADKYKATIPNE